MLLKKKQALTPSFKSNRNDTLINQRERKIYFISQNRLSALPVMLL
jgi:hypothetical protein